MVRALISGLAIAIALGGGALGQTREALIIANQDYAPAVGLLANTHEDADLVAAALEGVGFHVRVVKDADRLTVLSSLRDHAARVAAGGQGAIGLFYYSGHGAADTETGRNYLIPVDVTSTASATLWDASVQMNEIQRRLSISAPGASHFIIFDACRNELRLPFRDASRGFVPQASMGGMFVSFSTAPGMRASDGDPSDPAGPFALAFVEELARGGGRDATSFFSDVKFNVRDRTGGSQLPWQVDGLSSRVYPFGEAGDAPAEPTTTAAVDAPERLAYEMAETPCDYQSFVDAYPDSVLAPLARGRAAGCGDVGGGSRLAPGLADEAAEEWGYVEEDDPGDVRRFLTAYGGTTEARDAAQILTDLDEAFWRRVIAEGELWIVEDYLAAFPQDAEPPGRHADEAVDIVDAHRAAVAAVQRALNAKGFDVGVADGRAGPLTVEQADAFSTESDVWDVDFDSYEADQIQRFASRIGAWRRPGAGSSPDTPRIADAPSGARRDVAVEFVQGVLAEMGYFAGQPDGVRDPATDAALADFFHALGFQSVPALISSQLTDVMEVSFNAGHRASSVPMSRMSAFRDPPIDVANAHAFLVGRWRVSIAAAPDREAALEFHDNGNLVFYDGPDTQSARWRVLGVSGRTIRIAVQRASDQDEDFREVEYLNGDAASLATDGTTYLMSRVP